MALYNRTLEAMKAAGVKLVPFNAAPMVDFHNKYIGDSTFYTYEMGREVSRCAPDLAALSFGAALAQPAVLLTLRQTLLHVLTGHAGMMLTEHACCSEPHLKRRLGRRESWDGLPSKDRATIFFGIVVQAAPWTGPGLYR